MLEDTVRARVCALKGMEPRLPYLVEHPRVMELRGEDGKPKTENFEGHKGCSLLTLTEYAREYPVCL